MLVASYNLRWLQRDVDPPELRYTITQGSCRPIYIPSTRSCPCVVRAIGALHAACEHECRAIDLIMCFLNCFQAMSFAIRRDDVLMCGLTRADRPYLHHCMHCCCAISNNRTGASDRYARYCWQYRTVWCPSLQLFVLCDCVVYISHT